MSRTIASLTTPKPSWNVVHDVQQLTSYAFMRHAFVAGTHKGAGVANVPNSFCWNELATTDTEKAGDFYTNLFGWGKNVQQVGPMTYTSFMNGDRPAGGMYKPTPDAKARNVRAVRALMRRMLAPTASRRPTSIDMPPNLRSW